MPESSRRRAQHPYHKDRFAYDEGSDSYLCPYGQTLSFVGIMHTNGTPRRMYRLRCHLPGVSGLRTLYQGRIDWTHPDDSTSRHSVAQPVRLDVHPPSHECVQVEKADGRTCLRDHQGAIVGTEVSPERPGQSQGRVDRVGDCPQLRTLWRI